MPPGNWHRGRFFAPRSEIYLKDLTVGQGDTATLKATIGERD